MTKSLKKKYKILLITLLLIYPVYKGVRELFWVKHISYNIDNNIKIKLRVDTDIFSFQDFNNAKTITVTNKETGVEINASFVSLESNLYFYIDTINSKKMLLIIDKFAGKNTYDYSTLKLVSKEDCFIEFGGCGGFNDSSFEISGKPNLTNDKDEFHR